MPSLYVAWISKHEARCSTSEVFNDIVNAIQSINTTFSVSRIWDDIPLTPEVMAAERTRWETRVKDSYRRQAEDIIRKKEEKDGPMGDAQKQRIRDNFLAKSLPEMDYINHLSSLKKEKRIHEIIQNIVDMFDSSKVKRWAEKDFIHFKSKAKRYFDPK